MPPAEAVKLLKDAWLSYSVGKSLIFQKIRKQLPNNHVWWFDGLPDTEKQGQNREAFSRVDT